MNFTLDGIIHISVDIFSLYLMASDPDAGLTKGMLWSKRHKNDGQDGVSVFILHHYRTSESDDFWHQKCTLNPGFFAESC